MLKKQLFIFVFGLLHICITPPFQPTDENAHFLRAFQVSEGVSIGVKVGNESGGYLPPELNRVSKAFSDLNMDLSKKISFSDFLNRVSGWSEINSIFLEDKSFVSFSNTVLYSPVMYLPQQIPIRIGHALNLNPISVLYLMRLMLLFSLMVFFGIIGKLFSISKKSQFLCFLLLTTPTCLHYLVSANADFLTIIFSFLCVGMCINHFQWAEKPRYWVLFFVIVLLLSLCRMIYFFPALLMLPLIFRSSANIQKKLNLSVLLIVCALLPAFLWAVFTKSIYSPARFDVELNPNQNLIYAFTHPIQMGFIVIKSLIVHGKFYLNSFLGVMGWVDTSVPNFFKILGYIVLLFGALRSSSENNFKFLKIPAKILFALFSLFLFLTLYLSWMPVGANIIDGVNGKYFIPISVLFVLMVPDLKKLEIKRENLLFGAWVMVQSSAIFSLALRYWVF